MLLLWSIRSPVSQLVACTLYHVVSNNSRFDDMQHFLVEGCTLVFINLILFRIMNTVEKSP